MKKNKKILLIITILLLIITCFSTVSVNAVDDLVTTYNGPAEDSQENSSEPVLLEEAKEENKSIFIRQNDVTIDYNVNGNVFIIGKNVTIDSVISGNSFILADTVNFTSNASVGYAFVYADNVAIAGYVTDLYCYSTVLNVERSGYITRDLYCSTNTLNLQGYIARDAHISISTLTLSNDVNVANIGGSLYYSAAKNLSIPDSAAIGQIEFTKHSRSNTFVSFISSLFSTLIYSFVVIIIILVAFKEFPNKFEDILKSNLIKTVLFGLLSLILLPIISFILISISFVSGLGIILLLAYILLVLLADPVLGLALGRFICEKLNKNSKEISSKQLTIVSLITILVLNLLTSIPFIGTFISIILIMLSLGIVFYMIKPIKK